MIQSMGVFSKTLGSIGTSLVLLLSPISLSSSVAIAGEQETASLEEQQSKISQNSDEAAEDALQKSITLYRQQNLRPSSPLVQTPTTSSEETHPSESPKAEPQVLIAEVVIEGTEDPELQETVFKTIKTQPGQPTTRSLLQQDVDNIFATGFFSNVTVVPEDTPLGVRVIFVVEANPILSQVVVRLVPEDAENRILTQSAIDETFGNEYGKVLDVNELQANIQKLNEWYKKQGYDLAQVFSVEVSENGIVTLTVAEGVIKDIKVRFFNSNGNSITGRIPVSTIMQEIDLKSGDVFNREIANKSLQKIKNIELFEDFEIDNVRLSFELVRENLDSEFFDTAIINLDITEITLLEKAHRLIEADNTAIINLDITEITLLEKVHGLIEADNRETLQKAISVYQKALQIYQSRKDTVGQALALTGIADAYRELENFDRAFNFYSQALLLWRIDIEQFDESEIHSQKYTDRLVWAAGFSSSGIFADSHGFVSFRFNELVTLINLSNYSRLLGDYQQAVYYLNEVRLISQNYGADILASFERVFDLSDSSVQEKETSFFISGEWLEGLIDYGTGLAYSDLGQQEQGFDYRQRGLVGLKNGFESFCESESIKNPENKDPEIKKYLNYFCGQLLPNLFQIIENQKNGDFDSSALFLTLLKSFLIESEPELNKLRFLEAYFLQIQGKSSNDSDDWQQALDSYKQARQIYQELKNDRSQAYTLNSMAEASLALNNAKQALDYLNRALAIWRTSNAGERFGESDTLIFLGKTYSALGQYQQALTYLEQAKQLSEHFGYVSREAEALLEVAKIQKIYGNLFQAKTLVEQALNIIELQRKAVAFQDNFDPLLSAVFGGDDSSTLSTRQEQSISRTNANQSNYQSYTDIVDYFDSKQEYYEFYIELFMQLHQQNPSEGYNIRALEASERNRVQSFLTFLESESRSTQENASNQNRHVSNSLKFNNRPRLSDIQEQILDEDTVLLEYALGEERSYLWFVTQTGLQSYELPKQETIEAAAREFYDYLTVPSLRVRDNKTAAAGLKLSQMILPPAVAEQLGNKRLLIVGDGILQYIPFSAIPIPQPNGIPEGVNPVDIAQPLLTNHEIVTLPSASTLTALRRNPHDRPSPTKQLAVFADPVFGRGDSQQLYAPLPKTREQARQIIDALPPGFESQTFFGHDASRQKAVSPDMSQYQILHFASHGILDREQPERSGMVLSAINEEGELQRGLLSTPDTFNLNLSADLVVLSGCRTGLGKEYRGEGIVGLTGGLMYGGAKRVVVSLWSVEEEATTELMGRFYKKMFGKEKLPPAAALRAAQLSMWEDSQWKTPYNWAAFTIQGEWNDLERLNH